MPPFRLIIALSLLPLAGAAQTPGRAVEPALHSLLSAPGSCYGEFTQQRFTSPYFPAVAFFRGLCVAEHGDSASAVVALDADSVLYLLSSRDAFNFLVSRHPPPPSVDSPDLGYALAALEFSGALQAPARIDSVPPGRKSRPWSKPEGARNWIAVFTTVSAGGDGPVYRSWTVHVSRGNLWLVRETGRN